MTDTPQFGDWSHPGSVVPTEAEIKWLKSHLDQTGWGPKALTKIWNIDVDLIATNGGALVVVFGGAGELGADSYDMLAGVQDKLRDYVGTMAMPQHERCCETTVERICAWASEGWTTPGNRKCHGCDGKGTYCVACENEGKVDCECPTCDNEHERYCYECGGAPKCLVCSGTGIGSEPDWSQDLEARTGQVLDTLVDRGLLKNVLVPMSGAVYLGVGGEKFDPLVIRAGHLGGILMPVIKSVGHSIGPFEPS